MQVGRYLMHFDASLPYSLNVQIDRFRRAYHILGSIQIQLRASRLVPVWTAKAPVSSGAD